MDTLIVLKEKIHLLSHSQYFEALNSIVMHISRAEKYFNDGRIKTDEQYFNDVIYRANQAFEGILREAYRILIGKNPHNKRTVDIEDYFEKNNIFNERVKKMFTNYRTNWRNASTHDYSLFFSEEEAILALNSVTSFIYVLLNQITEKIAYLEVKSELENINLQPINITSTDSLYEIVSDGLVRFAELQAAEMLEKQEAQNIPIVYNEYLMLGKLQAYIESLDTDIKVFRECEIGSIDDRYLADIVLEKNNEKLILELKRAYSKNGEISGTEKLIKHLSVSNIDNGILYIVGKSKDVEKDTITVERNNHKFNITKIVPIKSRLKDNI